MTAVGEAKTETNSKENTTWTMNGQMQSVKNSKNTKTNNLNQQGGQNPTLFFFFLIKWNNEQNYRKEVENIGNFAGNQRNFPTPEENPTHARQDLSRNGTR